MNQTVSNIVILVLGGILAWALFFRTPSVDIREIKVPVPLTPHQLDSLELAIKAKVKGELKPIILPPIKIVDKAEVAKRDSIIREQLNAIISLKDSLKGKAKLNLEYHGEVGTYKDTLDVVADFISDTISVVFKPKQRDLVVIYNDTTKGRNFFQRLSIGPGIGIAPVNDKVSFIPMIGIVYDIFGK
jgi:hypothetical protein